MEKKSCVERWVEKRRAKYIAKHGEKMFFEKTAKTSRQYLSFAIIKLFLSVLWLMIGASCIIYGRGLLLIVLDFINAGFWALAAGLNFYHLPFYYEKATAARAELKKLEAYINKS